MSEMIELFALGLCLFALVSVFSIAMKRKKHKRPAPPIFEFEPSDFDFGDK